MFVFGVAVALVATSLASANKLCSPTNPCNLPNVRLPIERVSRNSRLLPVGGRYP